MGKLLMVGGQGGPEQALPPWVGGPPCQRGPGHSHASHCLFQNHAGGVVWVFLHTLNPHFASHWQCDLEEQKGGLVPLHHHHARHLLGIPGNFGILGSGLPDLGLHRSPESPFLWQNTRLGHDPGKT